MDYFYILHLPNLIYDLSTSYIKLLTIKGIDNGRFHDRNGYIGKQHMKVKKRIEKKRC